MPRIRSTGYGHRVRRIGRDHYRMSWVSDRSIKGSRLRHPCTMERDTDAAGAVRFGKKWGCRVPPEAAIEADAMKESAS